MTIEHGHPWDAPMAIATISSATIDDAHLAAPGQTNDDVHPIANTPAPSQTFGSAAEWLALCASRGPLDGLLTRAVVAFDPAETPTTRSPVSGLP